MFLREFLEKCDFEKVRIRPQKHETLPNMQRVKVIAYEHGVLIRVNTVLYNFYTVNSLMFTRILFSRIGLKSYWHIKNLRLKPQLHSHNSGHDSSQFETDGKIREHRDASGLKKKRKSSINTVSHYAPTVPRRFVYGSTTTHDGSARIHHGGATNAHDASTIRYGASTIQAGSATVASQPTTNVQDLVVVT